nr:broad1 isoform A-Z4-2 [Planococcus kraunhiae]BAU79442.1 broad1 isoform B-Z4-2 [Planococcus kraunhiae]
MMAHFRMPPPPSIVERVRATTMGDLQHFCLRWNNYQNSITTAFENLRDDEDFIDVTLACDGKTLKAHRLLLSACSPYFRELLKSTPCKHPVIVLQDVVFDDLHALVEFIYHGEVNVHQKNLTSFLKTAEVLKVSGLTQQNSAATNKTPASSASPSSDHYNENSSGRFSTRSPGTSFEKMNPFQQPFLYETNHSQINFANDDRNYPRTSLTPPQMNRHRRHFRSPTPIRCSQSRVTNDDSPIPLKRAKSADNALQPPLLHCSNTSSLSPTTISNDDSSSRICKNSCKALSSSRHGSPNEISNLNINNSNNSTSDNDNSNNMTTSTAATTTTSLSSSSAITTTSTTVPITTVTAGNVNLSVNYDENHNDEDAATMTNDNNNNNNSNGEEDIDEDDEDEPPVDFSITSSGVDGSFVKKHDQQSHFKTSSKSCSSPKNLSLKCEPIDLVSSDNANNNFNDDDSNQSEDRLSDQSPPPNAPYPQTLLEDAFQGHRGYLDSKLFAAAGASFSFNMAAAALAADSLAGFNHHQSHSAVTANAVLDGLAASSQDWAELEQRSGNQGKGVGEGGRVSGSQQQHGCFICGKMLSTRLTLKRHIEQQHHQPLHSAVCTICHKVFRTLNSLNNHKSIYHRKPKWSSPSPAV